MSDHYSDAHQSTEQKPNAIEPQKIPTSVFLFLGLGLLAASQSANIIRLAEASPYAVTSWRVLLATIMFFPFAYKERSKLLALTSKEMLLLFGAGLALAFHFFAWIAAVQTTTVANAVTFFTINPVITAVASHLIYKEALGLRLSIAILIGIAGTVIIGWQDLQLSSAHFKGDLLAVLCSILFTVYFLLGKKLRARLPTQLYVTSIYMVAAVPGFIVLIWFGFPIVTYSGTTWLSFILMALLPTMIGHTSFNHALNYISAGKISASTISEAPMAGIVAYFAWGEVVPMASFVGYAFIAFSILILFQDN